VRPAASWLSPQCRRECMASGRQTHWHRFGFILGTRRPDSQHLGIWRASYGTCFRVVGIVPTASGDRRAGPAIGAASRVPSVDDRLRSGPG